MRDRGGEEGRGMGGRWDRRGREKGRGREKRRGGEEEREGEIKQLLHDLL